MRERKNSFHLSLCDFSFHHLHLVSFQYKSSEILSMFKLIQHRGFFFFFIVCDPNYFQTPLDYSWMSRPILISTADVFKSLGSLKWNTSDGGWVNTSWFILRPAFPCVSRGFDFNSKRSATHKHFLHQSTTSLRYACFSHFSFTLVYTAALKRRVSLRPAITLMENMSG